MSLVEALLTNNRANDKPKTLAERKHEQFAREYLVDFDHMRAYKCVYDPEGEMDDMVALKASYRMLKLISVQNIIDREECRVLTEKRLEKNDVIAKMQRLYSNSMRDKDYASAKGALDMLAKHFGLYNLHNKQKKYSPDDITAIRQKLEANGVSLDAVNKPKELDASTNNQLSAYTDIQDAEIVQTDTPNDLMNGG